jgi:hypothetical protein
MVLLVVSMRFSYTHTTVVFTYIWGASQAMGSVHLHHIGSATCMCGCPNQSAFTAPCIHTSLTVSDRDDTLVESTAKHPETIAVWVPVRSVGHTVLHSLLSTSGRDGTVRVYPVPTSLATP